MLTTLIPHSVFVGKIAIPLAGTHRWKLACTSKKVRQLILDFVPRPPHTDVDTFFVMLAFERVDIEYTDPFVHLLMTFVFERERLNFTAAFRRWVHTNHVCIDRGGFYVRLQGGLRVRIGWFETGCVCRMQVRNGRLHEQLAAIEGFEVYDGN
jgi:hypothetical protein